MNYSCINFKINVGNLGNDKIVLVIPNGAGVCASPCMLLIVLLILNKADVLLPRCMPPDVALPQS